MLDESAEVARARAGDRDAYEALVARYGAAAYRAAVLLGAGDDAEDAVQEAFVRAYRALAKFRGGEFRPWLLAIVANQVRNLHRSRRRYAGLLLRTASRDGVTGIAPDDPAGEAEAAERRAALLAAVRTLPARYRDVIVCRYFLDLDVVATAAALGWPSGSVKSRTARALDRLRSLLGPSAAPDEMAREAGR